MVAEPKSGEELKEQIDGVIDDTFEENVPITYTITPYGADYPVESIVNKLRRGDIFIPAFQRQYVWTHLEASRFVESLLLGLPVPGVFMSKEEGTGKLLVIDGQQRLKTLQFFYDGIFKGRSFMLKGVQPEFEGRSYKDLQPEDIRRLDDSIIHATIIKQDKPSGDQSSIYHIFERLNTSGKSLHPQEIRACIFHGEFNELLGEINQVKAWREIFGKLNERLKDQELVLRFFAFYYAYKQYVRPMKLFLNNFMSSNRNLKLYSEESLKTKFKRSIELILEAVGPKAFRFKRSINAALYEAVMVGVTQRLDKGPIKDKKMLLETYAKLLTNSNFETACRTGTSDETKVSIRLKLAIDFFNKVT